MTFGKFALAGAAAFALSLSSAGAVTLFSENFDDEAVGGSVTNFIGFDQFTVDDGSVDLIANGGFGISCVGNTGGCVDLDGTTSSDPTSLILSTLIEFQPGFLYTLSFDLSGNQRGADSDGVTVAIDGVGSEYIGPYTSDTPFQHLVFDFTVDSTFMSNIAFSVAGHSDYYGMILDNVLLTAVPVSDVPLPAAAPLMLMGLGGLFRLRRRKKA